ncbi:MAG: DedA family protein [Planctomycetota bacterium]|jgi:membrane protein DedA with SNARE-associated domain|nr:DedA family protein [Planctomycetota bacterium]
MFASPFTRWRKYWLPLVLFFAAGAFAADAPPDALAATGDFDMGAATGALDDFDFDEIGDFDETGGAVGEKAASDGFSPTKLLRRYGYFVILIWTFFEGETIVIIASALANKLGFTPWLIALAAFCGSFLSDQLMFSLGKYKGHDLLRVFPRIEKNLDKAAALFKRYDNILILGFRFVYGIRNVTPVLLGLSGVSHKKFFGLNFVGGAVWALTFSFGGYYSGKAFIFLMDKVKHGIFYALIGVVVIAVAVLLYRRSRAARAEKNAAKAEAALPEEKT